MVAGYDIASQLRGYTWSSSFVVFWLAMAVVAGPVVGIEASWLDSEEDIRAGMAVAPLVGVLVGEGIYSLREIAATTSTEYRIGSIIAGTGVLIAAGYRLRSRRRALGWLMGGSLAAVAIFTIAIGVLGGVEG